MLWGSAIVRRVTVVRLAGAVSSGVLLALAYAPFEQHETAWVALVPLILISSRSGTRAALGWGFLGGAVFWLVSLSWFSRLAWTGPSACLGLLAWFLLALYCALYTAAFAMLVSGLFGSLGTDNWRRTVLLTVAIPAVWVGLEYFRSTLLTGFPWNTLGVSQYRNIPICQAAEWGGVYAVSMLVALMNSAFAMTVLKFRGVAVGRRYRAHPELMIALSILVLSMMAGVRMLTERRLAGEVLRIALVQPNVPQVKKWSPEWADEAYLKLRGLTEMTFERDVDLIVWPETALPSYALLDQDCLAFVCDLLTNGTPILVGTIDARLRGNATNFFNSSMLFDPEAPDIQIYNKQHLLPFGEYIPLSGIFPSLARFDPLGWSCTPGKEDTIFRLQRVPDTAFSVLICFEDVVSSLSRKFVRAGARLLINQTNDAWFDVSSASRQHMANSVFRCIENRVPMIRVTNTGMTCLIDAAGRIRDKLAPDGGALTEGFFIAEVVTAGPGMSPSFYTKHGDVFAVSCAVLVLACFVLVAARGRSIKLRTRCLEPGSNEANPKGTRDDG